MSIVLDPTQGLWKSKTKYKNKGLNTKQLEQELAQNATLQIHQSAPKVKEYTHIIEPEDSYQADLMFFPNYKKYNSGYDIILNIIETTTKKLYSFPLKKKSEAGPVIKEWVQDMLDDDRKIQKLTTDAGTEFINKSVKDFLTKHKIHLYNTTTKTHTSIVERVNGTLRMLIERYLTLKNTYRWVDVLPDLVNNINGSISSSTHFAPDDLDEQTPESYVERTKIRMHKLGKNQELQEQQKKNFPKGTKVRVLTPAGKFEKGALPKWSKVVYEVVGWSPPSSIIVKNENDNNNQLTKKFYELLPIHSETKQQQPLKETLPPISKIKKAKKIEQAEKKEGIQKSNIIEAKRERKPKKVFDL